MRKFILSFGMFLLCATVSLFAAERVKVDLILPPTLHAGSENMAVLRLMHEMGWHTYGPAEVGATTIDWTLPKGWVAGEIQWPNEENFELQGVSSWGYSGVVELRVPISIPSDAKGAEMMKAKMTWVVCGEGMCLPGNKDFLLDVYFKRGSGKWSFANGTTPMVSANDQAPATIAPVINPQPTKAAGTTLIKFDWKIILAAFVGGMILNLMPCVFPILGVKILSFVKHAGGDRRGIILEAGAYGLGILASAILLGVTIVILRSSGAAVGWGFQLQDSRIVWAIVALLGLVAMNMADGWALPSFGGGAASGASRVGGWLGAFFSGALMVAVATPCSAPFLAVAIGGVFALPALQAVGLMAIMGVGIATPYWVLAAWPGAVKALPKPGEWMENLKKTLAWVMAAAAVFEAWVYVGQVSPETSLRGLMGLLILFMGIWAIARWHKVGRLLGILLVLLGVWMGLKIKTEIVWETWSPQRVSELRKEGREIVVDFTARWCVNCLINEKVIWGNKEILDIVKDKNIALLKADWTRRDEAIASELKRRGTAAVPLLVIYRPISANLLNSKTPEAQEGVELPNLLTVEQVKEVLQ